MKLERKYNSALLKIELLARGMKVDPIVEGTFKGPKRTRAGVSSGVDILLENEVGLNVPVVEPFCQTSPFTLTTCDGHYVLQKNGVPMQRVRPFTVPAYYEMTTSDGVPMHRIGVTSYDALLVAFDARCWFWGFYRDEALTKFRDVQCRYCSIGLNVNESEQARKTTQQILEVWEQASKEKHIRHIELNAGTLPPPGRGHEQYAEVVTAVRSNFDTWVKATIAPPEDEKYVEMLYKAGPTFVAYNYEIYDPKRYAELCPGKFTEIDKGVAHAHYDRILKYAVSLYGKQRVMSNLIVGLEPKESTVEGIEHLCQMGVIPRLDVFRPLRGTVLAHLSPPPVEDLVYVYRRMKEIVEDKYGLHVGESGCSVINVESLYDLGVIPHMPTITDDDLVGAGIDPAACR